VLLDSDAEIIRLRGVLRDLVALSAIPAVWIGTEPRGVAVGLADALVSLLRLDFAFVRLSDPDGLEAFEVTRGSPWKGFPEWLDRYLATSGPLPRNEIVSDVCDDSPPLHGFALAIGVNGEGGVVAAASERTDFPTATDHLLLSLAANHAAAAFQSARLIEERRRAEDALREARNELEVRVAERTGELRRSETYLAEAQRLTHTGSFAINVSTKQPSHSSAEHSRLYGFAPEQGVPSLEQFLGRIHPEDRARCIEALDRGIREATSFEVEHRVVLPQGAVKHLLAIVHPVFDGSGDLDEVVGTVVDVTERKAAEEQRRAQLRFLESMDSINRAIQRTSNLEEMLGAVLDVVVAVFDCDRAWLVYPCDPEVDSHRVRMERTKPEYLGAFSLGAEIPNDPEVAAVVRTVLASSGPVRFDPESGHALPSAPAEDFGIMSMIAVAVFPKMDKAYMFGLHQCSHTRIWTPAEERLLQEIGGRLADALDSLSLLRDLRTSERKLERIRADLAASRARIVAASDEARKRIERDLHDGVQQRLVRLGLELRALEAAMPPDDDLKTRLARTTSDLSGALEDLLEISRGIHPAILAEGGLGPALKTLAHRSAIPVELRVRAEMRLPAPVEVAGYYVVSEALTNAAKHSRASVVNVAIEASDGVLELSIRDDGCGGANPTRGSGLIGLRDRVEALGGTIEVASPAGEGTTLSVRLPTEDR
jgi:PAS domain S-box-containing protein